MRVNPTNVSSNYLPLSDFIFWRKSKSFDLLCFISYILLEISKNKSLLLKFVLYRSTKGCELVTLSSYCLSRLMLSMLFLKSSCEVATLPTFWKEKYFHPVPVQSILSLVLNFFVSLLFINFFSFCFSFFLSFIHFFFISVFFSFLFFHLFVVLVF